MPSYSAAYLLIGRLVRAMNRRREVGVVWLKLAVGAAVGLAVGHIVSPGYWLWLVIGVLAAFGAEVWVQRGREAARHGDDELERRASHGD